MKFTTCPCSMSGGLGSEGSAAVSEVLTMLAEVLREKLRSSGQMPDRRSSSSNSRRFSGVVSMCSCVASGEL